MAKRIDYHRIRKVAVAEPSKADIVALVMEQLGLGLAQNEIVKLVKETYFTQEIGDEERDIIYYSDGTELDEETGIEQDVYIKMSQVVL